MKKLILSTLVAVGLIGSAGAQTNNLIVNGGFEFPNVLITTYDSNGGWLTYGQNYCVNGPDGSFQGWSVSSGEIDLMNSIRTSVKAAEGNQFLDLDGRMPGSIQQSVPVRAGDNYVFSFKYARYSNASMRAEVISSSGKNLGSKIISCENGPFPGPWDSDSINFQADSDSVIVRFVSLQPYSSVNGVKLDDIRLNLLIDTNFSSKPIIQMQPTNVSLTAPNSQTATFNIVATNGIPPYAYQWMKDGVDLTNQTNASLVFSNAGANTVGYYSCDVTDQNGTTVTSSNAALNISGVPFWLWQGLVAYYPLNGNCNDEVTQSSGELVNITWTSDSNSRRHLAYFNGNSYVRIQPNNNLNSPTTAITLSAYVNPDILSILSDIDYYNIIFGGGIVDSANCSYELSLNQNGIASQLGAPDYAGAGFFGSKNLLSGAPKSYLLTVSFDGTNAIGYINTTRYSNSGIPLGNWGRIQIDQNIKCAPLASCLFLGARDVNTSYNDSWFRGFISDVRIYNRALSSNEVAQLYALESAPTLTPQTITFPPPSPVLYGVPPFTLTAAASSGLPVSYSSSSTNISISGNIVTVLGTGTATIVASQSGNSTYAAAPSITNTLVVNGPDSRLKNQTITFSALKPKVWTNAPFALTAKASSILPITYTSSDATVATISNNMLNPVGVGTTTITAYQGGNTIYNPAKPVSQQQVITQATQKITFPVITAHTYGDAPFTLSATSTSGLPITYTSSASNIATVSGNVVTIVGAGTAKITASQGGNALYSAATPVSQTLNVAKANQRITFSQSSPLTYSAGSIISFNATASSGLPITSYTSSKPAVITTVNGTSQGVMQGKGTTTITATQAGNANFNKASGSATITLQ